MQRGLLGIAIAAVLTTSAMAADLAVKAPPMVPPVVYNWTGFYIGGNVGYSWGRSSDTSTLTNTAGTGLFAGTDKADLNGVIGGGQIGYNWQMQNWLVGLEADIQGSGERGSHYYNCPTGVCTPSTTLGGPLALVIIVPGVAVPFSVAQRIDWFGTVRGRVGFLATPNVLFYGTGGLAYGGVNTTESIGGPPPAGFANTDTRVGWTVGAGVEGVISGNWTAKLEYLHVDLGTTSGSFLTPIAANPAGFISSNYSSHITDDIVRVGVNYRFSGAPLVARY
jgi:outer membrane immunogenic protein